MASKKQKIGDGGLIFQDRWTKEYFFVQVNNKSISLICNRAVSKFENKTLNGTILQIMQQSIKNLKINLKKVKIAELKNVLVGQQSVFTNLFLQQESVVATSYAVAKVIAKRPRPFSIREFVKDCFLPVLSGIQPAKLRRMGATLSLAHRGSLDPVHILYGLLSGSSDTRQVRLRSRRLFVPAARNLLDNFARLGIRASEWTNHK